MKKSTPPRGSLARAALREAKGELRVKIKQRGAAEVVIARLNAEIPRLAATVAALENQLDPATAIRAVPGVLPSAEVDTSMGSVLRNTPLPSPEAATTPEELPGMDGDFR